MLKIDLDYAKFVYKIVLLATVDQLWDEFSEIGMVGDFGPYDAWNQTLNGG